jgi:hypothetical protein
VPRPPPAAAKALAIVVKQTLALPASAINLASFAASTAQQACSSLGPSLGGSPGPSCTATTTVLPLPGSGRRLLQGGSGATTAVLQSDIVVRVTDALAAAGLSADKVRQVGAAVGAAVGQPGALLATLRAAAGGSGVDLELVARQAVTATVSAGLVDEGGSASRPAASASPGPGPSPRPSPGPAASGKAPPPYDAGDEEEEEPGESAVSCRPG